ncbi:hypothetical protein DDR33_00500 [Pararcticibacter amylolyticus]|uniref:Uncharacterized protein n=1 Tax=Pararcticibacter amylolyticus TaxID=2173175 RepID=A0A2U2PLV3_9SPHI|nr:hypothetical protein DDR33_00500 [Pararcticibacter amylolyticus]
MFYRLQFKDYTSIAKECFRFRSRSVTCCSEGDENLLQIASGISGTKSCLFLIPARFYAGKPGPLGAKISKSAAC